MLLHRSKIKPIRTAMKLCYTFLLPLLSFFWIDSSAQKFNLNFEECKPEATLAQDWIRWGDHDLRLDTSHVYQGSFAASIEGLPGGGSFGSTAYRIPANYEGSSLTLKGYIKTSEVSEGFAGLLMRVDGESGPISFDNMEKVGLRGNNDWKEYSVTLPYSEEAIHIYVGGILVGKGKAWFDDFTLTLDGNNIQTLEEKEREIFPAELDTAFATGSAFSMVEASGDQINNLALLARVWGFMKYRHPAVAAGQYNWDNELFRILPAITDPDFVMALEDWIESFALEEVDPALPDAEKMRPTWLYDEQIIPVNIRECLINVDLGKMAANHYYISMEPGIGNPKFKNEAPYKEMQWNDDGFRLLALFRYWNIIEYFFPYKELMDTDWSDVLPAFIRKVLKVKQELNYKLAMLDLIGKIQDTHANIWMRDPTLNHFHGTNMAPLEINFIEEKAVVVRKGKTAPHSISVGDVVKAVNDVEVSQLVAEKIKYCPASNTPTQMRDVAKRLLRTNDDKLDLTVSNDGIEKTISFPTIKFDYGFFST